MSPSCSGRRVVAELELDQVAAARVARSRARSKRSDPACPSDQKKRFSRTTNGTPARAQLRSAASVLAAILGTTGSTRGPERAGLAGRVDPEAERRAPRLLGPRRPPRARRGRRLRPGRDAGAPACPSEAERATLPAARAPVRKSAPFAASRRRPRARRMPLDPRHQHRALELGDEVAGLLVDAGVDLDDSAVGLRLRLAHLEHLGLAVERVAVEDRVRVAELLGREVGDRLAGDVGDRHPDARASRRAARRRRSGPAATAPA